MLKNHSLALLMLGFPMGMGMAPELHPDGWRGFGKSFKPLILQCLMKYAEKSVPGFADVGFPHGDGDGPRTPAPGSGSKMDAYHVDQHETLNGLRRSKATKWPNRPCVCAQLNFCLTHYIGKSLDGIAEM